MSVYVNSSIALIIGFLLLVAVIFLRPSGLFGKTVQR
jgi:branched-subunit amino acid ABC-type transport system permease component